MLRFNADRGSLYGNVRGKSSGNTITIVLDDFTTDDPDEHIAYGEIEAGKQIFRFEYNNSTYTVEPLGKMGYYFDGMTENTVVKI